MGVRRSGRIQARSTKWVVAGRRLTEVGGGRASAVDSLQGCPIIDVMSSSLSSAACDAGGQSRKRAPVDPRVRERLRDLAVGYALRGVHVFLFGSVARTWPEAHIGADLDLGYEIQLSQVDQDVLRRELERDIETLPSIRPVELVDFSRVTEAFRAQAIKHTIELAHEPSSTTAA
jgi:hypothetical protein